jgi:two-component system sensor histidine kinase BarA
MKPVKLLQSLGIRARVLILAAVPITIVVLILGYSLASSRLDDAQRALVERGEMVARNLALASEFALISQNLSLLDETIERVSEEPGVNWAAIWDQRRAAMSAQGRSPDSSALPGLVETVLAGRQLPPGYHAVFIEIAEPRLTDFSEEYLAPGEAGVDTPGGGQRLGFALVQVGTQEMLNRRAAIIRNSILLTLTGLAVSILLALLIGNSIIQPVLGLLGAVRDLQQGKLSARARLRAGGEIGALVEGVNQMAESLEHSQRAMQLRVEEATRALRHTVTELEQRNIELDQAREAALRAGRERTEFLARMSHEIRTPLNAILGFTKLLQTDSSGRSNRDHVRTVQTAAEHLLHVINDILQFIRLDAGADQLEMSRFDLADAIEDVIAVLGPMANEKGLELVLLMHSDLPSTFYGDRARLSQILVNLLNNAIKFTAEGQVVVEAFRRRGEGGVEWTEIAVRDTGIGLDDAEQQRLFSPFSQADSSINRRFGGSGLGLSIAQRLAGLMGGEIGLESRKGDGARFWLRLPCPVGEEVAPGPSEAPLAGRRALVYDANPLVRRSLRSMLVAWHLTVFNTGRWDQVSALLARQSAEAGFDAVILGLSAHERRADRVASYLRELRAHHQGLVLLLTGSENWSPPDSVRADPGISWSTKPVRRSTLQRLLGDLRVAAPAPAPCADIGSKRLLGMQILVAEDNAFNRDLLREVLQAHGADLDEVVSGGAAISAAMHGRYDVILMDLHMPEVDGAEAARLIRSGLGVQTPPIWALTADVFGRTDLLGAEACFDDWLLKPIDPELLVGRLAELRSRGQAQGSRAQDSACQPAGLPPELCQRYRDELQALIERLRGKLHDPDLEPARAVLHDLKGMVGVFGDARRVELVRQIALRFADGERDAVAALLDELQRCSSGQEPEAGEAGRPDGQPA